MTTLNPDYSLDVAGAKRLEDELAAVDAKGEVVVDLSAVAFVASSGLRVMLKYGQNFDKQGAKLVLSGANDSVREVLTMSGFDTILEVR